MEFIDIYTPAGKPEGTEEKLEAHRRGLLHRAVGVWILNSRGELLLQRRSPRKEIAPDLWDISFAGHISSGETPLEAVHREGGEELGLRIEESRLEHLFTCPLRASFAGGFVENEMLYLYLYQDDVRIEDCRFVDREVAELRYLPWRQVEALWRGGEPTLLHYDGMFLFLFHDLDRRFPR